MTVLPPTPVEPPKHPLRAIAWLVAAAVAVLLIVHFHPWESNADRANRLRIAMAVACLEAEHDGPNAQGKCDVTTRDFNKFMAGDWF